MKFNEIASDRFRWQLFTLLMVCFASAILGDSTAEALLLSNFDTSIVPNMFLVNAAALFTVSSIMMTIIDIVDRGVFFLYGLVTHFTLLIVFWFVITLKATFVIPVLFSYAYITKILIFMMFWTLANDLVDSRKAGKVFPFVAAGGTLGAVCVSFSIPSILKIIPAENLLLIWIFLIAVAICLFIVVKNRYGKFFIPKTERKRKSVTDMFKDLKLFRDEPLLGVMGLLYFFLFFLLLNQHYIFYSQIKNHLNSAGNVASFLGYFNGTSMVSTFLLQISVAGIIFRKFGSTRSMLLVPMLFVALFSVLAALSISSRNESLLFYIVVTGMGLRIAFFDSFFSPNFQVFFSSFPQEIRGRAKLAMEGVVKPCAMVLTGLWLMWAGKALPFSVQMIILTCGAVIALLLSLKIKGSYAESLTIYLTGFSGKKESGASSPMEIRSECELREIENRIKNEDPEIQGFLILQIASVNIPSAVKMLTEYFTNGNEVIRSAVLSAIRGKDIPEYRSMIIKAVYDPDFRVAANAVLALFELSGAGYQQHISYLLNHPHPRVRTNTIFSLWRFSDEKLRAKLLNYLHEMMYKHFPNESAGALYALGEMDDDNAFAMINQFIEFYQKRICDYPSVFNQTIRALSKKSSIQSLRHVLYFAQISQKSRNAGIIKAIGRIIKGIPQVQIIEILRQSDYRVLNLLTAALHQSNDIPKDAYENALKARTDEEIRSIEENMRYYTELMSFRNEKTELLGHAVLEEYVDIRIDTLVFMASVFDRTQRIKKIVPRLFHSNAHMRARAFEVLDNTGDNKFNRNLIRIIESRIACKESLVNKTCTETVVHESINHFLDSPDEWVAQCAWYANITKESNI